MFQLPLYLDYFATFLWAVSGGILAARRGYDIAGIFAIALATATGGGVFRDGIFLQGAPPVLVRTPVYLEIVAAGTLLVMLAGRYVHQTPFFLRLMAIADAFGLGAYAVIGLQLAASKGLAPASLCLVGVVNAVGGGVLRDVLMRQEPEIFRPGTLTATASLAGCLMYLLLTRSFHLDAMPAGWAAVLVTFAVRTASVLLHLETRPLRGIYEPADEDEPVLSRMPSPEE